MKRVRGNCKLFSFFFAYFKIREKNMPCYEEKNDFYLKIRLLFLLAQMKGDLAIMAKLESKFQKELIDEIKRTYPGCIALKNDAGYIQGFPDWTILYKDKWVALEIKRDEGANRQPNQEYYISKLDDMSYAAFVYPENKDKVLQELSVIFGR